MKLCFLAGADSIHSKKWIEYFSKKDHEVYWISLTPSIFPEIKNVKFYLIKNFFIKSLGLLLNILPVRRLIKKISPDVLHAHYVGVNGILGALSGFHPLVLTAWGSDILINTKSRIMKPLIKFVLRKADLITCDAEHVKIAIINLGIEPSKIKVIYFGIDTKKFSPGPKDEKIIQELNLGDSPIIISLRNLEPIYNVETLIKAIPIVLKEIPEVKFIIVGKGSEEKKLKTSAQNLKIAKNTIFTGFIPNDESPRYLRTADIYVSTALSDAGIAASTAEAMACGLPVIITNTGENEKWVTDGENGFIIPIKDSQILAEKIIYLLKNKNERKKFGERGRKIIKERNDYQKEMAKMEEIYYEFIKK